jgi:hypothetical protein
MNILDRPNRPLHFYGDTVRWAHRRAEGKGERVSLGAPGSG